MPSRDLDLEQRIDWDMQNLFNVKLRGQRVIPVVGSTARPATGLEVKLWAELKRMKVEKVRQAMNVVVRHETEEEKD